MNDSAIVDGRAAPYTLVATARGSVAEVRPAVEAALRAEGFGVLTEIDVAATFKSKLGVDWEPMVILGACNPPFAHRALEADPSVAALLPCNVVLRSSGGRTVVEAMDPAAIMSVVSAPAIHEVAREVRERLVRVIDAVESMA